MNPFRVTFPGPAAMLLLCLSAAVVSVLPIGCSNSSGPGGTGGSTGSGGGPGSGTGTGGSNLADAGSDARASGTGGRASGTGGRAATDAGSGAGGTIVMVDAAGNTLTCADLLACCNRVTNTQAMTLCLQQYNTLRTQGDPACGNLLTQIRANSGCP